MNFALVVPTYNPGRYWPQWLQALSFQTNYPSQVLVVDSESTDGSFDGEVNQKFQLTRIPKASFNHGGTRDLALGLLDRSIEVVVFLTQDALLANEYALERLVASFSNPQVAAAYGRQLPHKDAKPLGAHARIFNYESASRLKSQASIPEMGLKACFISNSFSAYRVSDLLEAGGFPENVILGEDMYVAGKLLLSGKSIQYAADACVYHSHDYSTIEEFRRYFDTGVFHTMEPWLMDNFGGASGEGLRFVRSELAYLQKHRPSLIIPSMFRTFMKYLGYKLGRIFAVLPKRMVFSLSMHKGFWISRRDR